MNPTMLALYSFCSIYLPFVPGEYAVMCVSLLRTAAILKVHVHKKIDQADKLPPSPSVVPK